MNRRTVLLVLFGALGLMAQQPAQTYTKVYEVSASAEAVVSTIQQPEAPTKTAHLLGVQIYSSAAANFTLEAAGAATGSSTNGVSTSPGQTTPSTVLHFAASDAVAPAEVINKLVLTAGQTMSIGFTDATGRSNSILTRTPGQNFTLRSTALTGDVKITWLWREE